MKKILCVLLATLATASFAAEKDCSKWTADEAPKIAQKVQGKGVKGLTINYSSDFATQATAFQSALQKQGVNVTMAQVSGTGKCEFTNFSK
ncbi:MAG: hypothetical protein E6Q33_08275 [Neisseriales bacterium]|jgi:hypothetical protein|uniref:Uncharacterized protein n=1 Tax=Aquella oligotrophica TaxID=2067065 RepID=A0A2I7N3V8_9NEIS|nr:hypothetical protein [Aquella oligotrophica]AUR51118.1 hypothetical protein CUN60_01950 [Aquella oligotrophica]TXI92086.1 MAG: hypothetical protein E6Q33_08275 [Neisseriales bacterium]